MTRAFRFEKATTEETDRQLNEALRGCARHSLPALKRLYDLSAPRLLAELVQLLGDPAAAEKALADCYLQVWEQAGMFSPGRSNPGTWLMSIARQLAIDTLRTSSTAPPDEVDAAVRLMHEALEDDPATPAPRMVLLARHTGRSPAEIGRALALEPRAVRKAIHGGLRELSGISPA